MVKVSSASSCFPSLLVPQWVVLFLGSLKLEEVGVWGSTFKGYPRFPVFSLCFVVDLVTNYFCLSHTLVPQHSTPAHEASNYGLSSLKHEPK